MEAELEERVADEALYLRFQATARDRRGRFPGVFGLVNILASRGKLTEEQERFRRTNNDWYDANFTNPSDVDPTVYDHDLNPGAAAWFKASAHVFIERVPGYLEILAAHGVGCEAVYSSDPGRIVYEDDHQIVVIPHHRDTTVP
ncbi:hypothetical protein GCM10010517_49680 [Streptosporangium fragile]|uniref:Uncharacterized protein n=1 Tax=Streptosporangium fragile TaxID=46186 RepID=A0ABN3W1P4_9ACTN